MKEKIINLKNILRIIISLFVIFSMFKSCKAFAAGATASMLQDINTKTNTIFEYYGKSYRNKFNSSYDIGYNTSINKMCIGITASDSPYRANWLFVFYPDNNPMGVTNRSPKTYNTWFYAGVNMDNGNYSAYSGGTIPITTKWAYIYTEFAWQSATGYSFTANEEYGAYILTEPPNPFYFGNMFSQNYNYNNEVIQACELNYNYRIQFIENVVTEDYEVISINATLEDIELESVDLGSYWTLKCTNSTLLKYNKIYTLNVEINREDTTNELSEQILFVPPGTLIESGVIINYPSGDYSFNTENATNQVIENQNKNNSFWENTYNELFVMESGDVEEIIENMKANLNIDNIGDMSGEIAILNTLTGEPGDFIIAWNPTTYMNKTIIPSGEINFSQKVREVPALQTAQNWLRIIMGYSISIVLLSEIFFTILKVLGVSVSIYEQHNEEIERLEEMHTPKVYDTEVMTPKGIKRYRTRRTRIQ